MVLTTLLHILAAFLIFCVFLCAGFFFKRVFIHSWRAHSRRRNLIVDEDTILFFLHHVVAWFIMAGVWCVSFFLLARVPSLQVVLNRALTVFYIVSLSHIASKLVVIAVTARALKAGAASEMSLLLQRVVRVCIFTLGFLTILATFGISIAPILTTLGIGGFAVALALQDTLANIFAGFYIVLARQIRIGDYIKLDNAEEGYVLDVSWRLTKIRTLANNVVLLPNSKLSQAVITNYYFPQKTSFVNVEVIVHSNSNLEHVQVLIEEIARGVMFDTEGADREYSPIVRFQGFVPQGILCVVTLAIKEIAAQSMVRHEFIKRLTARFKEKGIVIPYPVTAINLTQEGAHVCVKGGAGGS